MAVDPETLTDPKLVRSLLQNAKKAGRNDLVFQCQVRLAKLEGQRYDNQIEKEFWAAVTAAEELATAKNGKTIGLRRTLLDWRLIRSAVQSILTRTVTTERSSPR